MQEALGRHIIAEFYDCPSNALNQVIAIEKAMVDSAEKAGATIINSTFHHFAPFGVSGVVVIQESHLAIHTWPEYGFAAVDLFTCGNTVSPWTALEVLKKALGAGHISAVEMRRGQPEMLQKRIAHQENSQSALSEKKLAHARKVTKDLWFTERAGEIALSVKHEGELLFQEESPWQKVEVLQTAPMGRMLVLDGVIAATSLDAFVINEVMVHPALLSHPKPEQVLIVGGGDGGTAQEALKHPQVKKIMVIEQDELVTKAAQQWLATLGSVKAMQDSRLFMRFADAHEELKKLPAHQTDILIVDAYNPVDMEDAQWHNDFYQSVKRVLKTNGLAVFQLGSPWLNQAKYQQHYRVICQSFGADKVQICQASVPSYPTGLWTFAFVNQTKENLLAVDIKRQEQLCRSYELQYYNEDIHAQLWTLPNFLRKLCM